MSATAERILAAIVVAWYVLAVGPADAVLVAFVALAILTTLVTSLIGGGSN